MTPIRIGIWFDATHCAYGGPTVVLLGVIIGFIQDALKTDRPAIILLNERGDINWAPHKTHNLVQECAKVKNMVVGPCAFTNDDAIVKDLTNHTVWNAARRVLYPSAWYRAWVNFGLPYDDPSKAGERKGTVWGAGVDVDFYSPSDTKTQDFFIYFKSQSFEDLGKVHLYLFRNYFKMRGTILTYYYYDPEMLRQACRASRFCIMVDNAETQGLAALEIMAAGCPLFVLDAKKFSGPKFTITGTSSVTCWDERCGIKSDFENMPADFPRFLSLVSQFKPREFVLENYSYESATHKLRSMLEDNDHAMFSTLPPLVKNLGL